jgi:hypothetical protein
MSKILVFSCDDDYVGHFKDCQFLIIPNTTPRRILDNCFYHYQYVKSLATEQVPFLEVRFRHAKWKIPSDFGAKALDAIKQLARHVQPDIEIDRLLSVIDRHEQ